MHVTNWSSSLNSISYSGQTYFHHYETKSGVRPCSLDYKNSTTIIESHKVKIWYLIKENPTSIIPIKFLSWFRPWWPNRCLFILFTLSHGSSLSYDKKWPLFDMDYPLFKLTFNYWPLPSGSGLWENCVTTHNTE